MDARSQVQQQKAKILRNLLALMVSADASPDQRRSAKQSLRRIGDESIVEPLGRIVEESNQDAIVLDCSEVLGCLPVNARVRGSLLQLLWHDSPEVRRTVMRSLARVGNKDVAAVLAVLIADCKNAATIFDADDEVLAKRVRNGLLGRPLN
jgi:HEAT repeat protein